MTFSTIGYQTILKNNESIPQRLKLGPIESIPDDNEIGSSPYSGKGFYFWDGNEDAATEWGRVHYKEKPIRIFKVNFIFETEEILDLVGNTSQIILLGKQIEKIKESIGHETENWKLSNYIEFLKTIDFGKQFNFRAIRFNDSGKKSHLKRLSLRSKENFINLNPFYIICVFRLTNKELTNYRFHFETK